MILASIEYSLFDQHETRDAAAQLILMSMILIFTTSCLYGIFSKTAKPLRISDKFELGFIEDNYEPEQVVVESVKISEPYDEVKELKKKIELLKLKKQLEELQKPSVNKELIEDCVETLISLGTPSRKAKAEAENIINNNPNIKTVQQFITEYGKRCA